ncbi:MAG TPA: ABC transporter permease, partial [Cyclobacteriaceae bacterium]|nr:ABC transporter permease [Cyclobacteriaceae bacterium]
SCIMLKNHLVGALRNFIKYRSFNFIHIVGLAVGLTAGIYVIYYARLEYTYDVFHENADRVYRVATGRIRDGGEISRFAATFAGLSPALRDEYPEVESVARMFKRWRGGVISYETTRFREQGIFHVDSGFFKVFSFPLIKGSADELLTPGVAFVEEITARKYFGTEDPVGKRIRFGGVDGIEEYEIRGVVRCPENSSIKFTFLFSYNDLARFLGSDHLNNWMWLDYHTFVKLKDGVSAAGFESKLPALLKKYKGERASILSLVLQPLTGIYFKSSAEFETGITGNEDVVRIMLILGITIVVIVWMNFVNLSTSQALSRAKEVGIRKTLGSSKKDLVLQFLAETAVLNLASVVSSFLLLWASLPYLNQLTGRSIEIGQLWQYLVLFFICGTFVMGTYPALQLAAFHPLTVLKGFFKPKEGGAWLREGFVALQALVSFSLIASIMIVIDQMKYVSSREIGISIGKTLVVRTPEVVNDYPSYFASIESYKAELGRNPAVVSVSTSADSPGEDVNWIGGTRRLAAEPRESMPVSRSIIDKDFIKAMGLQVIAGVGFDQNHHSHDILLNETGVAQLNFENAAASIGQKVLSGIDTFTVIGVLKDFHQVSPREAIRPTIYHLNLETPRLFFVRFSSNNSHEVVQSAESTFTRLFPGELFDYYYLDEFYDLQNTDDRRLLSVIGVFCGLAIAVSALGLLGLTWFRISRQKKELAVRKIIGSSQWQLFFTASRRLFQTTLIGCLIGVPVTWYMMLQWLQGFSAHTQPQIEHFVIALVASVAIALTAVSGYTLKIIKTNPAHQLRQE